MPIKEIITFSLGVLGTIFLMHGPLHFQQAIHETEVQILREVGRTDNWGNPSIFSSKSRNHGLKHKPKY